MPEKEEDVPHAAAETVSNAVLGDEGAKKKRRGFHPGLVFATVAVVLGLVYAFPVLLMRVRAEPNEAAALAVLRTFARRTTLAPEAEKSLAAFLDRHGDAGLPSGGYLFFLYTLPNFRYLTPNAQVPKGAERSVILLAYPVAPGVSGQQSFAYYEAVGEAGILYARPAGRDAGSVEGSLESLAATHGAASEGGGAWMELPLAE